MSSELTSLYQEVIIDHARRPHNFGPLEGATCTLDGHNPLCGDQLTLYLTLDDDTISAIGFEGAGCAISQASASLMTDAMKGLSREQALALFTRVHTMLTVAPDGPEDAGGSEPAAGVGKMVALSGIWEYPTRVKCASLAWQTLRSALKEVTQQDVTETVRTE
ncbi:MAG: Fe-S cluster assembly sulfur transfer protein SufU [Jatrophihabitantaceae bacterium]